VRSRPLAPTLRRFARKFRLLWKYYLWQSSIAALVVFIVFLILDVQNAVIITSIGATAFIVFTMPKNITAEPRRVIGGHLIGLLSGSLIALIPHPSVLPSAVTYALAVGISIFLMVMTNTEHPPASGTALGVTITGFSPGVAIAVVTSAIILSLAHHFLKRFLKDLTW